MLPSGSWVGRLFGEARKLVDGGRILACPTTVYLPAKGMLMKLTGWLFGHLKT